jgi:dephospho-CoA kinase
VRETAEKLTRNLGADAIVVNQIPLLFETDGAKRFDYVITVECAEGIRVERLKDRGMKEYEISKRMQAQASDEQRASIAHFVLKNEGSIDQLQREVQKMWESQLLPRIAKQ